MAFRLGKTFILSRREKKVNINENDLSLDRVSNLFKVSKESLYLEDMSRNSFFPGSDGRFCVEDMEDMNLYMVEGEQSDRPFAATTTYPGLGTSNYHTLPRPLVQQRNIPFNASSPQVKKNCIRRAVLLGDFDDNLKLIITGSAYLQVEENKANQEGIADLVKQYTNSGDSFIICDGQGFEITDNPGTRGFDFWKPSAKKFVAVKINRYFEISEKRENKIHKRKRSSTTAFEEEVQLVLANQHEYIEGQKETIKLCKKIEEEIQNRALNNISTEEKIEEKIEEQINEVKNQIGQVQNNIKSDLLQISTLKDMMADSIRSDEIVKLVRAALTCQICQRVPKQDSMVLAVCCGQLIGCGDCTQKWLMENETCPLCRNVDCVNKVVPFRSLDTVLTKLN